MTLFKENLDGMGCTTEGCDHSAHDGGLYFHGRCHPGAGNNVQYKGGLLDITCKQCKKRVALIAVAEAPNDN